MKKYLFLLIVFLLSLATTNVAHAQNPPCTSGNYVWCMRQISNVSSAGNDVKTTLKTNIQSLINKGDLAPARIVIGEDPIYYAWGNPADIVYALSSAYPYYSDDPAFQASMKTYMQNQLNTYHLWSVGFKTQNQGQNPDPYTVTREAVTCSDNRAGNICAPRLWNMYALWLYANSTGDWAYIQNNWSSISSFFNGKNPPANPNYEDIAGAIGVARMARHIGQSYTAAETLANNLITSGLNYSTFQSNSVARFGLSFEGYQALPLPYTNLDAQGGTGVCGTKTTANMNPPLLTHLTPEVARYINDNPTLKTNIINYFNKLSLSHPAWMVNKSYWQGCEVTGYHEATTFPPNLINWMLPAQAWLITGFSNTGDQLRPYVDGPYLPVGDYDYLSNMSLLYEAYGTTNWCDVTVSDCAPITTPTPTACQKADITQDNLVDLSDYSLIAINFFSTNPSNPRADINSDGLVDLSDYSQVAALFLQTCN